MAEGGTSHDEFGPLEREVMEAVWAMPAPVAVREIVDSLNDGRPDPLAYTTVMTVMTRLADKRALERRKVGRGYVYEATAPDAAGFAVKELLRRHGDVAVAHLVDEAKADPELLDRLRRLLDERDG
jgi:predicted transcriptional regulator